MNGNKKIYIWYGKYEIVNKVKNFIREKIKMSEILLFYH